MAIKAYVLAAGYATRLGAIARDRAKPLLEVGDKPVLSYTVERLQELEGLSEVVVVTTAGPFSAPSSLQPRLTRFGS